jgi:uncharacterized membrane protein
MRTGEDRAVDMDAGSQPRPGEEAEVRQISIVGRRIDAVDLLRGIVMVVMLLDHTRDFVHTDGFRFDAADITRTWPLLFLTRWITHFCAPIFVLLAGTSAYLIAQRLPKAAVSAFLAKRGLWLIVLEVTVVLYAWSFRLDYPFGVFLQVIWAIGVSMLALSLLVRLPLGAIFAIGFVLVAGHNLLDPIEPAAFGRFAVLWQLLHVQGLAPFGFIAYPVIPWIGIMALGYVLGVVFTWDKARRRRMLLLLGVGAIVAFVLLRVLGVYGDPEAWDRDARGLMSIASFLDVEKYPPSLLYTLMTLGPGLVALAALERAGGWFATLFETYGRVPLFAYVVHIVLAHLFAGVLALATGFGTRIIGSVYFTFPPEWGYGLGAVYLWWLVVLAVLYPMCRWFGEVKRRRRDWWLAYL